MFAQLLALFVVFIFTYVYISFFVIAIACMVSFAALAVILKTHFAYTHAGLS